MRKHTLAALLSGVLLAWPALAHHSFAMFDRNAQVEIEGVVKEFQFTNPHSWIQVIVTPADGGAPKEWSIEALSPNVLGRAGWKKNTLKSGDRIKLLINPLRDGNAGGNLLLVTLPDGTRLGGGA
jgi:hypothetical protein